MGLSAEVVARVAGHAQRACGLPAGEHVLALVSGGADSTLLAHVLAELGYPLELLHVAHGLRADESERDVEACRALAADLGAPLHVVAAPVADGPNLEARAREARRAAATATARDRAIATGHTRDDRVETVLYRLAASRGAAAFGVLPARDGAWVRPLGELTRAEVREALVAAHVPWREDRSNDDRRFARNRVRLDLLPSFRTLHPAAEANLLATADELADERAALQAAARELLTDDGAGLDVARAAVAPAALARAALRVLAGRPSPPRAGLDRALALCASTAGTASAPLDATRRAERRYGRLSVRAVADPGEPAPAPTVPHVPGVTGFGPFTVCCREGAGRGLDPALAGSLRLRPPRDGERLAGRGRTVRRLLLDAHVPSPLRDAFPVVDLRGEAVCLPGVALSPAHACASGLEFTLEAPA